MKPYHIIVVGGGASGMTAAVAAKRTNSQAKVYILEHKDVLGKKILSTGNGRCNFTNAVMTKECFFSDSIDVAARVLKRFGTEDTLRFFGELGILPKDRNGYFYPRSDQAAAVADVLRTAVRQNGITADCKTHVQKVNRTKSGFVVITDHKTYKCDRVILSTGGRAASVLGSDGSGYGLAKSFGHSLSPVVPALVQLKAKQSPLAKASGVRTDAKVTAVIDGREAGFDTGELQITAYGISGIPVFQISRHIAKGLYAKKPAEVHIDFMPSMSLEEWKHFLDVRKQGKADWTMADFFIGVFNQKLIPCLLKCACIHVLALVREVSRAQWECLSSVCKKLTLQITDTNGFENAQVCAGGVRLEEIYEETFESRFCKGLYLTGELLDAEGICGGYNLQWAWASGYIAGSAAAEQE